MQCNLKLFFLNQVNKPFTCLYTYKHKKSNLNDYKCALGIKALENYRKEWNDQHGCWSSKPLHNFASHGADAFRMLVVSIGKVIRKGLSAEEWRNLREQYII